MTITTLAMYAIAAGLFLLPRLGPRVWSYLTDRTPDFDTLLVREAKAIETLRSRAIRRKCDSLAEAVEAVENCFMGGDEPR